MKYTFHGGIVFSDTVQRQKETALGIPFAPFFPSRLQVSLRQGHTELKAVVAVGDTVHIGDVLAADPVGQVPPLHCGVSGTVEAIEHSASTLDGQPATVITVTNDNSHTLGTVLPPLTVQASREALRQRMYDAGLVGMGGAGFPTHRKYAGNGIRHLLINGCECEPYLASDVRVSIEQGLTVSEGIHLLAAAAGISPRKAVFCTESPEAAIQLSKHGIRTILADRRYPQGSERQLITGLLGWEVPENRHPSDCGVIVSNVATAIAMSEAARGLPLTHRSITVSGEVARPVNLLVPIGTPFSELLKTVKPVLPRRRCHYIAGGPMTGTRIVSLDAGLPKTCGGITVVPARQERENPCIRCGGCVRVCPAKLMPFRIEAAYLAGEQDNTATACISCGCCSYICPAKRRLAAHIGAARSQN